MQPRPLSVTGPLWAGLIVAIVPTASSLARSPDIGPALEAMIAAFLPVGFVALMAARTNRRTAGPHDVPWSPG